MDQYPQHMKISELSTYSKTPVTTIRYYIREGLLPQPLKTAKTMAYYTHGHLNTLLKIKYMQDERNFSLSTIKDILSDAGDESPLRQEDNGVRLTSTREEIIRTAVELFREKGYDGVTIANIAAIAKIGKGTFYQYFKNKEELFCECFENIFCDIGKDIPELQIETDGLKRLWLRTRHFLPYAINILEMLSLARYESFINPTQFKEKWDKALYNFIEPIRKEMELIIHQNQIPLTNSELVTYLYMGAAEYFYYYILNYQADPQKVAEEFWKFFFNFLPSLEGQ